MKKTILVITIIIAAVVFAGCGEKQAAEEETTNNQTDATAGGNIVYTPKKDPVVTTELAELDGRVYTNEKFGYKITLPEGYSAEVKSYREGSHYDQDMVTIKDKSVTKFCKIDTPQVETGFEMWNTAEERNILVPGSDVNLHWVKLLPDPNIEEPATNGLYIVSWTRGDDWEKTGWIIRSFDPDDDPNFDKFTAIVNSLRFTE